MTKRGIYIMANDRFKEQSIALLNSIRFYDQDTPVILIPYDDNHQEIAAYLNQKYGVEIYPDLEFIERLSQNLQQIFGEKFFARPNQFRKQACWYGPFDQFLYLDTDVVVFEKIIDNLAYLDQYDFLCCDYQHLGGIKNVFRQTILDNQIITKAEIKDIFNCGFWASKKNLISENLLYETFTDCANHPEYFDFSEKTSDQPIINYLILKQVKNRFNLVNRHGNAPGNWAGSSHFQQENWHLIDPRSGQKLQYLHWAGFRIEAGSPYWEIWQHYRYLNEETPPLRPQVKSHNNLTSKLLKNLKSLKNWLQKFVR